jgi:hypothetical protein
VDLFRDKQVHDFKMTMINDTQHLTLISQTGLSATDTTNATTDAAGYILDSSYRLVGHVALPATATGARLDMHEFTVIENGTKALITGLRDRTVLPVHAQFGFNGRKVLDSFFQEVEVETSNVLFEWYPLDHISLAESTWGLQTSWEDPWDFLYVRLIRERNFMLTCTSHLNSVEKTPEGDYLVSSRHTNAIYLVSGENGSVVWRLGGTNSSFSQNFAFNFSCQHDARLLAQSKTEMIISFLDNHLDASPDVATTSNSSSLLVVSLDLNLMSATIIRQHHRPDRGFTTTRGNMQYLGGNVLGSWGENGYVTEHTESDELAYEAVWLSSRYDLTDFIETFQSAMAP